MRKNGRRSAWQLLDAFASRAADCERAFAALHRRAIPAAVLAVLTIFAAPVRSADSVKTFDIAAQAAATGLNEFARQADITLAFSYELVSSERTSEVRGELTVPDALRKLLQGTRLGYKRISDKSIAIDIATSGRDSAATATNPAGNPVLIAKVEDKPASQPSGKDPQTVSSGEKAAQKASLLTEIIVTGSRIPEARAEQTQPVRSYTRENIERSGQSSVADFLNTLPDVSLSGDDSPIGNGIAGKRAVSLHGLPVGTTLVLLNGRRVETSFFGFFDLNSIPAAAVERVDVLPVGASAIYGADALGGAVNIILRKDMDGIEVSGRIGHIAGANDTDANFSWGKSSERGAVALIGTYQEVGELEGDQREPFSAINFPAGAPTFYYVGDECSPGNVYSLDGSNLPGLSSPQAGIPNGISGKPTTLQFAATAGKLNQCNSLRSVRLIPRSQRIGALLSAHYQASDSMDFFAELLFSHERLDSAVGFRIDGYGGAYGATILGASNPYNPFGQDVGVSFVYPDRLNLQNESGTLIRPLIGVRGSLASQWHYEATATFSRDRFQSDQDSYLSSSDLQAALNSSDPTMALNPFASGVPGTPPAVQALLATAGPAQHLRFANQILDAQGVLRGPLFRLPAGAVEAALGSEYSRERQESDFPSSPPPLDLRRNSYAVFAEARIPVLGDHEHPRLTLKVAGRYDHTDDFGGKPTWQSALQWRVASSVSINGNFGISYRAPQLKEIGAGLSITGVSPTLYVDPFRGGEPVTAASLFGGNPNLKPETGNSRTLEIAYASRALPGLETSLTYFAINISNFISIPQSQTEIDNPNLYPGAVVRAAPTPQDLQQGFLGKITQISSVDYNFGDVHVAGFDADVSYSMDTALGSFKPALAIANIYRWESALVPGIQLISTLSQANYGLGFAPRWKATAGLAWSRGPISAAVAARYTGRYKDYQEAVPNSNELGSFWIVDINARYELGRALARGNRWIAGAYIAVGAVDLFDKAPQFSYGIIPYDSASGDIRGRLVYAQIGTKW